MIVVCQASRLKLLLCAMRLLSRHIQQLRGGLPQSYRCLRLGGRRFLMPPRI